MNRERRFGMRIDLELPMHWYSVDAGSGAASVHEGVCADLSAMGASFISAQPPPVGETIVVQLQSHQPPLDVASPARVIRVTRAAGGYRCAVRFVPVNAVDRVELGKFVIAVVRERAA